MLTVNQSEESGVVVVSLKGTIDGGESCRKIHEVINEHLEQGHRRFVFDLAGVEWINSLGAGFLVAAALSASREEAVVKLVSLSGRVETLLQACGLVPHVWKSYDDAKEALESF